MSDHLMILIILIILTKRPNLESFWKGVGESRRIQSYKALTEVSHLVIMILVITWLNKKPDPESSTS